MNRTIVLSVSFSFIGSLQAQFPYLPMDSVVDLPGKWNNVFEISGSLDYNANSIYNELTYAIYNGEYLDRAIRERSLEAMEPINSAGYELLYAMKWNGAPDLWGHAHWRPTIRAAHHDVTAMRFTPDVFEMAFFGNAPFEGDRADLGPSAHSRARYQTLGAGIQDARSGTYVRLDLVLGQSISTSDIQWAGVYTAEDGRAIRASLLGSYQLSDTAGSEFGRNNGMGASLSGRWNKVLERMNGVSLSIGLEDMGFIRWNDQALQLSKDTVIEFQGFAVPNILDLDNVLIGEDQLIDTLGLRYTAGPFTTITPFILSMTVDKVLPSGWRVGLEIAQRYLPGFIPQATGYVSKRFGERSLLGASLGYGGFGGVRLGLAARFRLGERVWIDLSSPHVPGFLLGTTRGYGVRGGLTVGF